jgi:hypothetical protein
MRLAFVLFLLAPAIACGTSSSGSSTSSTGSSSSSGSTSSGGSSGSSGGTLTGTIGGASFTIKSGFGHMNPADGGQTSIDLVFSNVDAVCDSVTQGKLHAGEVIIQLYGMTGTAPGTFTSANGDVKYASVSATCASGQRAEQNIAKAGSVKTSTITISKLTSTDVEGNAELSFDDGSTLSGSFQVPICSATTPETSVCY